MATQYNVFLIGGDDSEPAVFTLLDEGDDCRLCCEYRDGSIESTASDYFQALAYIRNRLAADSLIPFCYGASLNVYPSGMARSMGNGLQAYKLTMSKPPEIDDLVDVFAVGPGIVPASVKEQEAFYRDWLRNRRSR